MLAKLLRPLPPMPMPPPPVPLLMPSTGWAPGTDDAKELLRLLLFRPLPVVAFVSLVLARCDVARCCCCWTKPFGTGSTMSPSAKDEAEGSGKELLLGRVSNADIVAVAAITSASSVLTLSVSTRTPLPPPLPALLEEVPVGAPVRDALVRGTTWYAPGPAPRGKREPMLLLLAVVRLLPLLLLSTG